MKFPVVALLLVMATLSLAKDEEVQFESLADARKSFADRKLCFIGILEDYTDSVGDKVDPHKEVVQGVRFSILWSAKEPKPESYWMHICFEPTSGEIFGKRKKRYAVTLEGAAKFGAANVDAWPDCAWAFKFTPIKIKQAPAVAPKPKKSQQTKVEQDGADQPATAPESKSEGSSEPKPDSEGRPQ